MMMVTSHMIMIPVRVQCRLGAAAVPETAVGQRGRLPAVATCVGTEAAPDTTLRRDTARRGLEILFAIRAIAINQHPVCSRQAE